MPLPVSTIIFDLGGVLVDWNPRYLYRDVFRNDVRMEQFLADVCNMDWIREMDQGKSFQQAVDERIARFPEHTDALRLWHAQWERTLRGPIGETVEVLRSLKRSNHRLVALTNWSAETFPIAKRRFDFLDCFEDILVSGEHGMAKPDRAIFELACRRWNIAPHESLFIDDNEANIITARSMNFHCIHFTDPAGLASVLPAFISA